MPGWPNERALRRLILRMVPLRDASTHQGEFMGVAPTGRQVKATGMVFYRFLGGKVAEQWVN